MDEYDIILNNIKQGKDEYFLNLCGVCLEHGCLTYSICDICKNRKLCSRCSPHDGNCEQLDYEHIISQYNLTNYNINILIEHNGIVHQSLDISSAYQNMISDLVIAYLFKCSINYSANNIKKAYAIILYSLHLNDQL